MSPSNKTSENSTLLKKGTKKLDNQDLARSGFWLGQVFTIAATIIGVYLAAQAGLHQAIEFDDLQTRQDNYYLRSALYDEVRDNVQILQQYNNEVMLKGTPGHLLKAKNPNISTFVWEAMKYSETTLSTPSFYLTETRRFYSKTNDIINKAENSLLGKKYAAELLKNQLDRMRDIVLPKMRQDTEAVAEYLQAKEIDVIAIKGKVAEEQFTGLVNPLNWATIVCQNSRPNTLQGK